MQDAVVCSHATASSSNGANAVLAGMCSIAPNTLCNPRKKWYVASGKQEVGGWLIRTSSPAVSKRAFADVYKLARH